ncbi:MAG: hypothetical protein ABJH04_07695 [Cyclobacteriaceae bacterium]
MQKPLNKLGVEPGDLRNTLVGSYLSTALKTAKNKLHLLGELTEDEYLQKIFVEYHLRYSESIRSKVHPVTARETAIAHVTQDFLYEEVSTDAIPQLVREHERSLSVVSTQN